MSGPPGSPLHSPTLEFLTACLEDVRESLKAEVCHFVEQVLNEHLGQEQLKQRLSRLDASNGVSEAQHDANGFTAGSGDGKNPFLANVDEQSETESQESMFGRPVARGGGQEATAESSSDVTEITPIPVQRMSPTEAMESVRELADLGVGGGLPAVMARNRGAARLTYSLPGKPGGLPRVTTLTDIWKASSMATFSEMHSEAGYVTRVVQHEAFDIFFNIIILMNCATLGISAHVDVAPGYSDRIRTFLIVCEFTFTALFTIELGLRFSVLGPRGFNPTKRKNWGNVFDSGIVVVTGIIPAILFFLQLLLRMDHSLDEIQSFTVLRAARLLRLVRVVQRASFFHECWLLLRGLTDSVRTLWWTCVVIFFITYIFAVFGLVLIVRRLKDHLDDATETVDVQRLADLMEKVGGLDRLMARLIQVLTMDSWNSEILRPMVRYIPLAWLYWYAYIALAVFVLMNLVTAIIVENAVTTSARDEEQTILDKDREKRRELNELELLFTLMDVDGSGTLSWSEFKAAFQDPNVTKKWKLLDIGPEDCRDVFMLLDDGSGEIETHDFFEGLARMKGPARSRDLLSLAKGQERINILLQKLTADGLASSGSQGSVLRGRTPSPMGRHGSPLFPRDPSEPVLAQPAPKRKSGRRASVFDEKTDKGQQLEAGRSNGSSSAMSSALAQFHQIAGTELSI